MAEEHVSESGLVRELRLTTAITVVVGTVIGSGIFIGANRVAGGVDSVAALFAVWIGAGILTLLGALTYAEFGAMYPRSGSDYVYVSHAHGPRWGFLAGWTAFTINLPASNAFLALAFAAQVDVLKPDPHAALLFSGFSERFTAIAVLAIFTAINYIGVRQGGTTQRVLTFAKVGLMLGLVAVAMVSSQSDFGNFSPLVGTQKDSEGRFILALVAALFAYDGWSSITRVAGEVQNPQRVVPRALTLGVLTIITVYVLMNAAYLVALGLPGMEAGSATEPRPVASLAAQVLVGDGARLVVAAIVATSILGTINGLALSGPRIYFAMARDRLFFPAIARVHRVHRTPHVSIVVQSALSALLILFVPFGFLQNYVVLGAWFNYVLTGTGLLRHRRTHPDVPRPYRVPFYPVIPLGFVVLAAAFLLYLVVDYTLPAFRGDFVPLGYLSINLVALGVGFPVYNWLRHRYGGPARAAPS